jgi:thioredoxin 1
MNNTIDDERERILEAKKQELRRRLENGDGPPEEEKEKESPSEPIVIDGQAHFRDLISEHDTVLVDCYADWCGPCKMLEPTIESLAADTDAAVVKVDIDAHRPLAQQLGARSVPTLVLYADGEPVERMLGVQEYVTLERLVTRYT